MPEPRNDTFMTHSNSFRVCDTVTYITLFILQVFRLYLPTFWDIIFYSPQVNIRSNIPPLFSENMRTDVDMEGRKKQILSISKIMKSSCKEDTTSKNLPKYKLTCIISHWQYM